MQSELPKPRGDKSVQDALRKEAAHWCSREQEAVLIQISFMTAAPRR